jgi:outer membrane lipoprotein-sorting protein
MTMMIRALMATLLLAAASVSFAKDDEVEKLLSRMREVYSSTKTARITVKTSGPRFGRETVTTEVTYMRERKIYAKLSGSAAAQGRARIFISDGQKVSVEDLSHNVQVSRFDPDFIPIPVNLEVMSLWDWKRQLSTEEGANMEHSEMRIRKGVKWNGKEWWVLEETANGQNVYVDYHIDPKTALIHRVQVFDLKKKQLRTEMVVSKLERNVRVDPGLFKVKTERTIRKRIEKKIDF